MNTIKTFLKSVYSKDFYTKIIQKDSSIQNSFWYGCKLAILSSLIVTVSTTIGVYTEFPLIKENIVQAYPSDLVLTITDGTLRSNQPNPYVIDISNNGKNNYILIDTEKIFDKNNIDNAEIVQHTILEVYEKEVIMIDNAEGRTQKISFADIPNMTISTVTIENLLSTIYRYLWILPIFLFLVFVLFFFISNMVLALIMSVVVMFVLNIKGYTDIAYSTKYSLAMHAITLVNIVPYMIGFLMSIGISTLVLFVNIIKNTHTPEATVLDSGLISDVE